MTDMIDFTSVMRLLTSIIIITFIAYILISVSNSLVSLIAAVAKKYKNPAIYDIDYNRVPDTQRYNTTSFAAPNKKEVRRNHGRRFKIPFYR